MTNLALNAPNSLFKGSDRIGQRQETIILAGASSLNEIKRRSIGLKVFELKNHLGNVLATVSERIRTAMLWHFLLVTIFLLVCR